MKVITTQLLTQIAANRWKEVYYNDDDEWFDYVLKDSKRTPKEIFNQLIAINPNDLTPEVVESIIGNNTWTSIICTLCFRCVDFAIEIDDNNHLRSHIWICRECGHSIHDLICEADFLDLTK